MKHDVRIKFYKNSPTEITAADKVELLTVGDGVLSVIKGDTNHYYNLRDIMVCTIKNREDSECRKN